MSLLSSASQHARSWIIRDPHDQALAEDAVRGSKQRLAEAEELSHEYAETARQVLWQRRLNNFSSLFPDLGGGK